MFGRLEMQLLCRRTLPLATAAYMIVRAVALSSAPKRKVHDKPSRTNWSALKLAHMPLASCQTETCMAFFKQQSSFVGVLANFFECD